MLCMLERVRKRASLRLGTDRGRKRKLSDPKEKNASEKFKMFHFNV